MRPINKYSSGWFGTPGDMAGSHSTLIHVVGRDEKPACGSKLSEQQIFQFCSGGINLPLLECKHCIRLVESGKITQESI